MHRLPAAVLALLAAASAGAGAPLPDDLWRQGFEAPQDAAIRRLSDAFDSAATLGNWQRIWRDEYWPADQLEALDLGVGAPGWLTLLPRTSGWYQDYRGDLLYKPVAGDVVVTTRVDARNRDGSGAPGSSHGGGPDSEYSLAGLMLRAPRSEVACCDAGWWQPGGERYVFLAFGAASQPGAWQFETKTTRAAVPPETHSISDLVVSPASPGPLLLRSARIGPHVLLLVREAGQPWRVQRRIARPDFPAALQVGLTVYTDWEIVSTWPVLEHNGTAISHAWMDPARPADPDLRARFDFVDFARPQVPAHLIGADLSNPAQVSDAELLAFLGQD